MAKLTQLREWYKSLPMPWRLWRVVEYVDAGDEIPEQLPYRGVVLVGTKQNPTWAALDCPCGTGHRLLVNLNTRRLPRWRVRSESRLSLRPSINVAQQGRRCHFVLSDGKVRWVTSIQETTT